MVRRRRLLSLGRRLVSVRAGLGLRRLLFGCRRLRSLTCGLGFALLVVATGGERSRCRGGCAHCRSCGRDLGRVLDRLERLFAASDDAVAGLVYFRAGLTAAAITRLRPLTLGFRRLRHLGLLLFESCEQFVLDRLVLLGRDGTNLELPLGRLRNEPSSRSSRSASAASCSAIQTVPRTGASGSASNPVNRPISPPPH